MELDTVPKHLLIVGGGYIAIEFGQMFHHYGSQVTIIELGEQLLAGEDIDVAEEVCKILREDGIDVRLKARAERVKAGAQGEIQLTVNSDGGEVMTVLQVAMMGKLPDTVIWDGIFAHPTLAESLNNLFMAMDGQRLHEEK